MKLGIPAKIFVPSVASQEKVDRIRANGAELVIGGERYADAQAASEKWRAESGAMMVHPYDQEETMLGQGSVGLEFEEQAPEIDTLLVAVGGGGLIGGIASWYAGKVKIIGVEPETAPTLFNAMRAGKPVDSEAGGIAADSLAPKRVGELMFPIAQKFVERVVLGDGRRDSRCAASAVEDDASGERAGRRRGNVGDSCRAPMSPRRMRSRGVGLWRQHNRRRFRQLMSDDGEFGRLLGFILGFGLSRRLRASSFLIMPKRIGSD